MKQNLIKCQYCMSQFDFGYVTMQFFRLVITLTSILESSCVSVLCNICFFPMILGIFDTAVSHGTIIYTELL